MALTVVQKTVSEVLKEIGVDFPDNLQPFMVDISTSTLRDCHHKRITLEEHRIFKHSTIVNLCHVDMLPSDEAKPYIKAVRDTIASGETKATRVGSMCTILDTANSKKEINEEQLIRYLDIVGWFHEITNETQLQEWLKEYDNVVNDEVFKANIIDSTKYLNLPVAVLGTEGYKSKLDVINKLSSMDEYVYDCQYYKYPRNSSDCEHVSLFINALSYSKHVTDNALEYAKYQQWIADNKLHIQSIYGIKSTFRFYSSNETKISASSLHDVWYPIKKMTAEGKSLEEILEAVKPYVAFSKGLFS